MRTVTLIPFLAALFVLPSAAQWRPCKPETACPREEQEPEICPHYSGPLWFKSSQGLVEGHVEIRQWHIANEETVEIPHQGFLVIQVRAGGLIAEVEGEPEPWPEGSFWSVPASQRLVLHTARDSVVLQVMEIMTE